MRIIGTIAMLLLFVACTTAQTSYSSKDKKAITLFEQAQKAPGATRDPVTGGPNYKEGIRLMDKALERDPNFWEAHVVAGEFAEYINQADVAIAHYEKALAIKPDHSPTGSTYFYLGNLYNVTGRYDDAIRVLDIYTRNPKANPQMVNQAQELIASSEFAKNAVKNPTKFEPVNLGPGINTADPEYFPTITVDGRTILFTRLINDKRVAGPVQKQEDFYVSELSDNNIWGKAVPMPTNVNTINNEGAPTIAADGRSLIFVACPDATGTDYGDNRTGRGSCDLFYTKKLGTRWLDPVNLPGLVNSANWETQPSISADGKTLYFIRGIRGRGAQNDADIYMSTLQEDGKWGPAVKLSDNINTPYQEESVLIHPDGKTLYFSSRGHKGMGGLDIFLSRWDDNAGKWGPAENLGYPINTRFDENSLMVGPDGEIAFFASDREGGYGDLDIYYFEMPEHLRPTKTLYFDGLVYDVTNDARLSGKFTLTDLKTGKEVVRSEADPVTGAFTVSLPVDREYALTVTYPGYHNFSLNFNMTNPDEQEVVHKDVPMVPLNSNDAVELKNVFFDFGLATLRPESAIELNKLADFLKNNPTMKIELGGHTDTRGDAADNLKLSQDRAKAVYDYLVKQGIDAKRLSYKGYGETQPIVSDEQIAKLGTEKEKEKAHQQNRRTVYRTIK